MNVSVIIPVYNREKMLRRAVKSVLRQTYSDYECIIVDDGSDVLPDLSWCSDSRFRLIPSVGKGVSAARNEGIRKSQGKYIAFLDSDDEWEPEMLKRLTGYFENHPDKVICQSRDRWIYRGQEKTIPQYLSKTSGDIFELSLRRCMISPSSVMLKRDVFQSCGYFDEKLPACEDYELWLRITARYFVGLVDEPLLIRYAGHNDQLSVRYALMDRFRIYALKKFLKNKTISDKKKKQAACLVLKEKCAVVAKGAFKRKRFFRYIRYRFVEPFLGNWFLIFCLFV